MKVTDAIAIENKITDLRHRIVRAKSATKEAKLLRAQGRLANLLALSQDKIVKENCAARVAASIEKTKRRAAI